MKVKPENFFDSRKLPKLPEIYSFIYFLIFSS